MGSPVSVVVAEIAMQNIEERALRTYRQTIPLWLRYIDDTFTAVHKIIKTKLTNFTTTLTNRTLTYSLPEKLKKMEIFLFQTAW